MTTNFNWLPCRAAHCSERARGSRLPFCDAHRKQIPEDLMERLAFAHRESGDAFEIEASVEAITAHLGE